jgi:hypothetical protein
VEDTASTDTHTTDPDAAFADGAPSGDVEGLIREAEVVSGGFSCSVRLIDLPRAKKPDRSFATWTGQTVCYLHSGARPSTERTKDE